MTYYVGNIPCVPSDELRQSGILGMKWHVRRFQNYDGSLTEAGKERYGVLQSKAERARSKADKLNSISRDYQTYMLKKKNAKIFKPSEDKLQKIQSRNDHLTIATNAANKRAERAEKKLQKFENYTNMYKDYLGLKKNALNKARNEFTMDELATGRIFQTELKPMALDFMKKYQMVKPMTNADSRKVQKFVDSLSRLVYQDRLFKEMFDGYD